MAMLPEEASKSAAVKEAAPLVVPSAAAFCIESVEPEKLSGEETVVDWTAPALVESSALVMPEIKRFVEDAVVAVIAVVDAYGKVLAPVAVEVMAPEMARVEVAVIAPPKNEVPEIYELPWTERRWAGVVVERPRLPLIMRCAAPVPASDDSLSVFVVERCK